MTAAIRDSILNQLQIVEENIHRLSTLVEVDLADKPNTDVAVYCCYKAALQLNNIADELTKLKLPIEIKRLTPTKGK